MLNIINSVKKITSNEFFFAACGETELDRQLGVMQLSEPLLWYILRVLDNVSSLSIFTEMGGVKVVCQNLVKSSNSGAASASASGGVIALVMEHLSNAPNVMPITAGSSSNSSKKAVSSLESNSDGLLNFAPLGTISCATAQPPDVLIQNATPHKRARTPAWSYHYYPDEKWVDLTITLPCAILLRQVELQPHHSALSSEFTKTSSLKRAFVVSIFLIWLHRIVNLCSVNTNVNT